MPYSQTTANHRSKNLKRYLFQLKLKINLLITSTIAKNIYWTNITFSNTRSLTFCNILWTMGVGAQNDLGGTKLLLEKWLDTLNFAGKIYRFSVQIKVTSKKKKKKRKKVFTDVERVFLSKLWCSPKKKGHLDTDSSISFLLLCWFPKKKGSEIGVWVGMLNILGG